MSGQHTSHFGRSSLHLEAARDWLARAEQKLTAGESVMAVADLMLAQAEIKLLVEHTSRGKRRSVQTSRGPAFRIAPVARKTAYIGALAACLIFGMILGRLVLPVHQPDAEEISPVPIASSEEPRQYPLMASEQPVLEETGPTNVSSGEWNAGNEAIPEAPKPVKMAKKPARPVPKHGEIEKPADEVSFGPSPVSASVELPVVPVMEPGTDLSKTVIHTAEIALETIRAMSERFNKENER